jgi:predicted phosphodiesterase
MAKKILNDTYEVITPGRVYIFGMGFVDLDESLPKEKALEIVLAGHTHLLRKVKPDKPIADN